jgi:hypothetical protein
VRRSVPSTLTDRHPAMLKDRLLFGGVRGEGRALFRGVRGGTPRDRKIDLSYYNKPIGGCAQLGATSQEQIRILAKLASTGVKVDSFLVPTYVCYSTSLLVLIISDFVELT